MNKFILFGLGFSFMIIGLFSILLYSNLLIVGYSFIDFVKFIISDLYSLLLFVGLFLIFLSMKGKKKLIITMIL